MSSIEERLIRNEIYLPSRSMPAGNYANYALVGMLLFVSGKGPADGARGRLGEEYSTEEGYRFARAAGIEVLAVLKEATGNLDRVRRVVKAQGFVNAVPRFDEHHKVMNGFSDLMLEALGENGRHARSVFGASSLREQLPVIIDSIFEIDIETGGGNSR